MKIIYRILIMSLLLQSCSTTDCIELEDIPTQDQTVCNKGLLIMRSQEIGQPLFSLDSLSKPELFPLVFENIRQDAQDDMQFDVFNRPSNYDAYDAVNNDYYIEFPLQQTLYKYNIDTQVRDLFTVAGFYAAPIFQDNTLVTITIDNGGYATNPANYEIASISTADGSLSTLTNNSFSLQSYFDWESMSSSKNNGVIYFVSGSNLVTYDTTTNTTQHIELVPDFDFATNNQIFYGLETRNNGNLLAIRRANTDAGQVLELVELNTADFTQPPLVLFSFTNNDIQIISEFYATTYDPCDDTYYITKGNTDFVTSSLFEINLTTGQLLTEDFDFYLMGIETKNN